MGALKRYFITGLLVVVPAYITISVLVLIVGSMDGVMDALPAPVSPYTYLPYRIPGLGILVTIAVVFIAGLVVQNFAGRKLVAWSEALLARVPVLRLVYNSTKQIMETFLDKGHHGLKEVVLVEFPARGQWAIGFVTNRLSGELKLKAPPGALSVFVPASPNPTSGFCILVPEHEAKVLNMSIEDAFKVIMTGGIVIPGDHEHGGKASPARADKG